MSLCRSPRVLMILIVVCTVTRPAQSQPLGKPDLESPGDAMIQAYLAREAARLSTSGRGLVSLNGGPPDRVPADVSPREPHSASAQFATDWSSLEAWEAQRPRYVQEYFSMLGLEPRPERTPLQATVTGTISESDYVVELLHYQSRPGLYVTGNLYRPAVIPEGKRLPAILYVCGHSHRGRNGNKVAYQSHGLWFARHGYVCLVVDTLQLGEIASFHHGTYNLNRWWWHSRGYTPAGVEAWNGIRGIDYLVSRPDVDPERIAVTGISGGGAATFWVAAADERVRVAVPVSGMADLEAYVPNRVINGHCDCMFLINTFQWPWVRIAGLIAPRPLLFVNSDQDSIFPMDANDRIVRDLERLYSCYGAGDRVDAVISIGGHAYRQDIRQAAFRFINAHLKGDARPITDSEQDLVSEGSNPGHYAISPEKLRVFPTDADLPTDQINTIIDERFVPLADPGIPARADFDAWKRKLLRELRQLTFRPFPESIPPARVISVTAGQDERRERMTSEPGIEWELRFRAAAPGSPPAGPLLVAVLNEDEAGTVPEWALNLAMGREIVLCEPRGMGATRWTRKNPPNYVERAHVLLGRTVDGGRIWDVIAAVEYLRQRPSKLPNAGPPTIHIAGRGAAAVIVAYAAALHEPIAHVTAIAPPASHMDPAPPQLLNVLRVGDIPDAFGMIAPRKLSLLEVGEEAFRKTEAIYAAAGASDALTRTMP